MLTDLLGNRTHPLLHYPCIDPRIDAGARVKTPKRRRMGPGSPPPRFLSPIVVSALPRLLRAIAVRSVEKLSKAFPFFDPQLQLICGYGILGH
jgi:hypothetical protein